MQKPETPRLSGANLGEPENGNGLLHRHNREKEIR